MTPPKYLFDRWGTCVGNIDDSGSYFDARGRRLGRVVGADVYHCDGTYRGRIDALGQYWDESGRFLAYLVPTVRQKPRVRSDDSVSPKEERHDD